MLKATENEETIGFFVTFLSLVAFQIEGELGLCGPSTGIAYNCNFNPICDIKILCVFACLPLCACHRDTNGSSLYDHARVVNEPTSSGPNPKI